MRRLRRCMGASDTCCSYGSLNSTPGFLGFRQNDPWKRTARRRQQRRLSRVYERPLSRWLQSRPPLSECRGRDVARVYETRPRGAATADVDVTLTCSSFTSELQRVFPWSLAYSLWQEQRQRQTSAPSAGSALPSIAAPEDGSVSSESPTVGEGYDWRHVFLVRCEPHPALPSPPSTIPESAVERGCGDSTDAAAVCTARRGYRESGRRPRGSQHSQADIGETLLNTSAAVATGHTCESRAVQLWREALLSSSSPCVEASCPPNVSRVGDSLHAVPRDSLHATVAGGQDCHAGARTPVAEVTGSPTTHCVGGGVQMTPAAVPAKTVSATPRRPLFAWTAPLTYELYHLCEDVDRPRSSAASPDHLCPAQVTRSAEAPLGHQRRRRDILRRLRRVGRLHTIPGLPQPPPLLLRRERATLSTDVPDGAMGCARRSHERLQPSSQSGAGEADTPQRMRTAAKAYGAVEEAAMDVEQEDVLVGTVCSLHDYCHHVTGIGDFAYGESWNTADGAAHLPLSHKDRLTTDAPAPGGRSAHVSEMAFNRVRGPAADRHSDIPADATAAASSTPSFLPSNRNAAAPADMFRFPPPLSRGIEKTCRGVCPTSSRERWCVPGDGDARKADFSELEGQPQSQHRRRARSKQGAATAYICPHRLYEDVGHHHWSCIELHAFLEAKVRLCRLFHESRDTTTTASSEHSPAPPQGALVVAPVTRPQERAAHSRRGRAAPTTDAGVLPLSSASCRTLSPSASNALEVGCSAAALSASHSVGVLLAHEQEWIYFSVLFHAHALPLPRASEEPAASRLASGRSFDLSQLYCFLHPPCRLYTEELEEWAHATRERRRERVRLRDGRCIQHGWQLSASAHGAPTQTHSTAARPSRSTDASRRATLMANAPLSPGAVSTVSPNTWLVYVHPDVSLVTLPRLWSCVFGEDAPSSSSGGDGTGQEAVEGDTARALDGHHDVDDHCEAWAGVGGRGKRTDDKGIVLSKLNTAVARKRRRQAAEVEMLCRYLLPPPPPPPRRNACSLLPVNQAEVSLSARERSRARPLAATSIEVAASTTPSMPSTAALLVSDMTPQRRPTSTAALPHEDDRHREQRWHALACTPTVSPLVRSMNFLKRQHWLSKPFALAEELKYGRVVKYGREKPVVPRVR